MALNAGQRVQTAAGRLGVVLFDNSGVTTNARPGVYVMYGDLTVTQEIQNNLTNVAGGYLVGTGPGQ